MAAEKNIDLLIQQKLFPLPAPPGVLVEVGAARPDYLSISASFRQLGWRVFSIEPNPHFCAMHKRLGYEIIQYACSDEDRDDVDFYVVNSKNASYLDGTVSFESFSSLGIKAKFAEDLKKSKAAPEVDTIKVNVRRLDTILQQYPKIQHIDVLAVDVEGWELSVMRGLNLDTYRPSVVILENLFKSREYRRFMRNHGYRRWKRLKPNEIYLRKGFGPGLWTRILQRFSR